MRMTEGDARSSRRRKDCWVVWPSSTTVLRRIRDRRDWYLKSTSDFESGQRTTTRFQGLTGAISAGRLGSCGWRITQSTNSGSRNPYSDAAFAAASASWLSSLGIFQNSTGNLAKSPEAELSKQQLPQVPVLDRRTIGSSPSVAGPALAPARRTIHHGVGGDDKAFEPFLLPVAETERSDGRTELGSIASWYNIGTTKETLLLQSARHNPQDARFRLPSINNRPAPLDAESTIVCAGVIDEDKGPPWHISVDQAKAIFGAAVKRTDDARGGLVFGVERSREDKRPNAPG